MKKKLTACLLALAMLCPAMPAAFATSGPDDEPAEQQTQVYAGGADISSLYDEASGDGVNFISADDIPQGAEVIELKLVETNSNLKMAGQPGEVETVTMIRNYSEPTAQGTRTDEKAERTTTGFSTYGAQIENLAAEIDGKYYTARDVMRKLYNNLKNDLSKGTDSAIFTGNESGLRSLGVTVKRPSELKETDPDTTDRFDKMLYGLGWLAYLCLDYDRPEMFYSNGWCSMARQYTNSSETAAVLWILPQYSAGFTELSERQTLNTQLNNKVKEVLQEGAQYVRAYDKMKFFHDWLCENNSYNDTAANTDGYSSSTSGAPWSCVGALLSNADNDIKEPVCEGYSRAFQLLCQRAGITATVVTSDSGNHMWNNLRYGQKWTGVDVTWDDGSGSSYGYNYFFTQTNNMRGHVMDDANFVDWLSYPELSVVSSSSELPFYDSLTWQQEAVQYVYDHGYMNGMTCVNFGVNRTLTRAEFAAILYNIAGQPSVSYTDCFTDVADGKWYTSAVLWAAQEGYVVGYGDGRFGPDDCITREQIAVMLHNCAGKPAGSGDLYAFSDYDQVSDWAWDAMVWANGEGIINGKAGSGETILDPLADITRGETAAVMKNADENIDMDTDADVDPDADQNAA